MVAQGSPQAVSKAKRSVTGAYLSGRRQVSMPAGRRPAKRESIWLRGATEHNLRNLDVQFPLGQFICVTGVSGSGKSTLITEILYRKAAQQLQRAKVRPGKVRAVEGLEHIDKVINIDQSPIGRTPRSNTATYTGTFTPIRELFAILPEARMRGYRPGRFSFNMKGGRCEACTGDGYLAIEMQFLPDVTVPCEVCQGARYNREALEIHYKGHTIADVLAMTVDEAADLFEALPAIRRKLSTIQAVGLGYITLGQPATTLSGGEAQRVKLSTELSKRSTGRTLYLLDEPTTGLAFPDIEALINVLQRLVDGGNTVVVIEHQLDVVKNADHIIDLGPLGGDRGGWLVVSGTPEEVAAHPESHTGRFLREKLAKHGRVVEVSPDGAAGNGARSRGARGRRLSGRRGPDGSGSSSSSGNGRQGAARPAKGGRSGRGRHAKTR